MTFSMPQKQPPATIATSRGPRGSIAGLAIDAGAELVVSQPMPSTASSDSARSGQLAMRFIMPQLRPPRPRVTASSGKSASPRTNPGSGQGPEPGDHRDDQGLAIELA